MTVDQESTPQEPYRSRHERLLLGVAGGLGECLDVDPLLIRLTFVALTAVAGLGLVAYLILALVMPQAHCAPEAAPVDRITPERRAASRQVVALLLIGLGVLFLTGNLGWQISAAWAILGPALLLVAGCALVVRGSSRRSDSR